MKVLLSVIAAAIVVSLIVMGVFYFDGSESESEDAAMPQDAVSSSEVSSPEVSSPEEVMPQEQEGVVSAKAVTAGASMAGGPPLTDGEAIYNLYCGKCHDPGDRHPGTMMLRLLGWEGDEAALVSRKELDPDYIRSIVRNGLIEMPPFRPSEISDPQLDALVDYLKRPKTD